MATRATPLPGPTITPPLRAPAHSKRSVAPLRLSIIGVLFLLVVIIIVAIQQSFLLPIYLSLLAWLKGILQGSFKSLTPKFLLAVFKNSLFLKLRQIIIKISTHFIVMSHRPWRRCLGQLRLALFANLKKLVHLYQQSPLWLRSAIALVLLAATASSSYLFIAILVIPQAVINWLRRMIGNTLSKLGISQLGNLLWKFIIPQRSRQRWYMYNKWTLGRRQIQTSKQISKTAAQIPAQLLGAPSHTDEKKKERSLHTAAEKRKKLS